MQVGDNQLHQQLSLTTWGKDNLTLQNIELNAHYQVAVANDLKVGVDPGFSVIITEPSGIDNPTFFGAQPGTSPHYTDMSPLFLGAEARYQVTNKNKMISSGAEDSLSN